MRENQPTKQTVQIDVKRLQAQTTAVERIRLCRFNPQKPEDPLREEETIKSNVTD